MTPNDTQTPAAYWLLLPADVQRNAAPRGNLILKPRKYAGPGFGN